MSAIKTFLSFLSRFWDPHPALFVGLSMLLGATYALFPHLVIPCILAALAISKSSRKWLFTLLLCALCSYLYTVWRLPERSLPQEKVAGTGVFHTDQVKLSSSFFNRSFLYTGTLSSFTTDTGTSYQNLPCQIYLPAKPSHPPADCNYEIQGHLCHKGDYRFVLKPNKKTAWKALPSSFSFAEKRFLMKQALFSHLKKYIADSQSRNLLYALISGDVDEKLLSLSFGKIGLQHLLAVSGFHFTLIGGFLGLFFRLFLPYRTALILLICLLSLYALFVGESCAIQRAYLAFFFVHLGKIIHLRISGLNALGLGLIVCIMQTPLNLLDLGFQFSFLCTLSLLLAYPILNTTCEHLFPKRTFSSCLQLSTLDQHAYLLCQWIRSTLSLNLAVHLFSLPLLLFLFHKFPLLSILYNLLFPLCIAFSLLLLVITLTLFPFLPILGTYLHSLNNAWTSLILFFTSQPPAALDFSIRTNLLSLGTTLSCIACLFFMFLYFSLKKKIFR